MAGVAKSAPPWLPGAAPASSSEAPGAQGWEGAKRGLDLALVGPLCLRHHACILGPISCERSRRSLPVHPLGTHSPTQMPAAWGAQEEGGKQPNVGTLSLECGLVSWVCCGEGRASVEVPVRPTLGMGPVPHLGKTQVIRGPEVGGQVSR